MCKFAEPHGEGGRDCDAQARNRRQRGSRHATCGHIRKCHSAGPLRWSLRPRQMRTRQRLRVAFARPVGHKRMMVETPRALANPHGTVGHWAKCSCASNGTALMNAAYGVMLSARPNLCLLSARLTTSTVAASVIVVSGEIFCLYEHDIIPAESTLPLTAVSLSSL